MVERTGYFNATVSDGDAVFSGYSGRELDELAVPVRRALHFNGKVTPKRACHSDVQLRVAGILPVHCWSRKTSKE